MYDDFGNWNPKQGKNLEIIYRSIKDRESFSYIRHRSNTNLLQKLKEFIFPGQNQSFLPPEPNIHQKYY